MSLLFSLHFEGTQNLEWCYERSYLADSGSLRCCLLPLFTSCSKSKSAAGQSQSASAAPVAHPYKDLRDVPGTVFDVSYTPETVRVDESSWRASLKSVSSDGNVFVFDNSDAKLSSLHQGSIMFLENLAVRSVLSTATRDGHFVVNTDRAGITDLIQNGTIHSEGPCPLRRRTSAL